jgi:hypothetical protein
LTAIFVTLSRHTSVFRRKFSRTLVLLPPPLPKITTGTFLHFNWRSELTRPPAMPSRISPQGFKPLSETILFTPLTLGALNLGHRIIQSPCTRMRGVLESPGVWTPGDLSVEYYAQRASKGGLQITEATNISRLVSPVPVPSFCSRVEK